MEGCNRGEHDGSVHIRGLERWTAEHARVVESAVATAARPRRVAIVGGGPAGLSAAFVLARAGHRATVFESERELGGVLFTGIPSYRLPREVVRREIEAILALGVESRCGENVTMERVVALSRQFDAVILATGLQRQRGLDVPGAKLERIEQGLRFLHRVNVGGGTALSGHVVVLGGGNTAIDCARSALRCGAERVTIAYRRSRAEMPAIREEIDEALEEGVELRELAAPVGFGGEGRVQSVQLARVELGEPDASGRREPIVTNERVELACDHVLLALGQSADLALLPVNWSIQAGRVLDLGRETNVFAAGDLATGDGTVTHAIGSGRRAATLALRALGEDVEVFERPDRALAVPITDIRLDHFARTLPAKDRILPAGERTRSFAEANLGLENAFEAHRCFSCGHCTRCDTCLVYCPEGIIRRDSNTYEVDYTYCKGCGICVTECPRKAMEMSAS
jgi:2-oxoacid:acceptor oxidoreductase delta subunit (pyruvate/2-ketoisovalerate family)